MAGTAVGMAFRHLRDLFSAGTVGGVEDGQLLARFIGSNDEVAFEALVARHGPMVLSTCRAVLKNEHDVEDAFQTTFLVLARKARLIRGGEALGAWLHRVAYRAAVHASIDAKRRRQKEGEASAMAPAHVFTAGSGLDADRELGSILHAEINRLPESQRLPVVLCDLEGLTYAQAAEQLCWSEPTLRCRLARARQRLRDRLTRRGLVAQALGGDVSPVGTIMPTVPSSLIRQTVLTVTGSSPSTGVAFLTHALLKEMLVTKVKFATLATLAAVALATAGVLGAGGKGKARPALAMKPSRDAGAILVSEPAPEKTLETVEIKGRVLAPDGRPVAGASIAAAFTRGDVLRLARATSATDGRFSIRLPRPAIDVRTVNELAMFPWLIVSAPGYGVGWCERVLRADRPAEQVVKLVEEGPPIEGRVVNLEGRPVVGAEVHVARIWYDERGDLGGWITKARNGAAGNLWQGLESLLLDETASKSSGNPGERLVTLAVTTNADGRFTLAGIGRDRIAELIVAGAGIATTQVFAFSRPEAEIRTVDRRMISREPLIVHAPKFQLTLAPARRVEGVIRDKDSGKPIPGLEIQAAVFDERSLIAAPGIEAMTDTEGRYRIDGLPKAAAYRLFIETIKGQPYMNATLKVPARSPGVEPVTFDIAMKRALLVRGRVTDKATGRPIEGVVNYYAFADNPNAGAYTGFSESYVQYAYFDEQGRYEIAALPGRGLIAVQTDRYRPASGYEKIAGFRRDEQLFDTLPEALFPGGHSIIAEVVAPPGVDSISLDLQADPGKSVPIAVVGPDGVPVGDTKVKGVRELFQTSPVPEPSPHFEIFALDPTHPRRVVVMHEGRKLIGTALLKGDETGPVTIRLQPWGSVAGRIVDDQGLPRKAMFISSPEGSENQHPEISDILPGSDWNQGVRVGDDGRFLIEGLVPGLQYSANARTGFDAFGDLFLNISVAVGEVRNLGDLKVQPPKKTPK